jgi:hypothetical protein
MIPDNVTKLPIRCSVEYSSLQEAARRIKPIPDIWTLWVSSKIFHDAQEAVKDFFIYGKKNPLLPQLNLQVHPDLTGYEWFVELNGTAVGTEGI